MFVFTGITAVAASNIDQKKQELKKVNEEIENTEERLEEVKQQQDEVVAKLQDIEKQLKQKERELNKLEKELQSTQEELEVTRKELEEAIEEAERQQKLMADRIRAIYMNGMPSYLELLLESKSINEFLDRMVMVRQLIAFDTQVLDQMKQYKDQVDKKRTELEALEQSLTQKKQAVARQKAEIEQKKKEQSLWLQQLKKQQERYERDLEELERTSKELEKTIQQLLRQLEEQRKRQAQSRGNGDTSSQKTVNQYTGGILAWPVPGFYTITSPFGYRIHPVYGVRRLHTGIDIGSNPGQSVYGQNFVAGADGTVIFAGWYGGYGNCVIIEHGGGITTLYAHGSQILVSAGQEVRRGQPIMKVGSTGISTGPHAHFEVRKDGVPVDPLPYLGR
nr:peptidoglycan DD-metalloendopeptidase family protein [Caldicoprobacter guelmensis]